MPYNIKLRDQTIASMNNKYQVYMIQQKLRLFKQLIQLALRHIVKYDIYCY